MKPVIIAGDNNNRVIVPTVPTGKYLQYSQVPTVPTSKYLQVPTVNVGGKYLQYTGTYST